VKIRHRHLDGGLLRVPQATVLDLKDQGAIRLEKKRGQYETWEFDLLDEAFTRYERDRQRAQLSPQGTADNDEGSPYNWDTNVSPVLRAIGRVVGRMEINASSMAFGAPTEAVNAELGRQASDLRTALALKTLHDGGYIRGEFEGGTLGPEYSLPLEKGLQIINGWPAQDREMAYEKLLAVLDERVASSTNEEEKTRWRELRDRATDVGQSLMTEVLAKIITGGM
jgi:hypothetical protein